MVLLVIFCTNSINILAGALLPFLFPFSFPFFPLLCGWVGGGGVGAWGARWWHCADVVSVSPCKAMGGRACAASEQRMEHSMEHTASLFLPRPFQPCLRPACGGEQAVLQQAAPKRLGSASQKQGCRNLRNPLQA